VRQVVTDPLGAAPTRHGRPVTADQTPCTAHAVESCPAQEIADQLVIAIGTVGKYTNNIFTKLGVRNRTTAVERSRVLGILSSPK
jgi:DNA-binding CsgD family transcriptional regulator